MKKTIPLILAAALLAPAALFAAAFEGTVKMKITQPSGQSMPVTFSMKSGLSRIDIEQASGQSVSTILNPAKHEATMIMPQQKMYMVHALPTGEKADAEGKSDATVEKTNEHEKILGYDATKYVTTSKGSTTEVWATEALGTFFGMSGGMGGRRGNATAQSWENALRGKEVFPLRVVSHGKDGKETFRMEATEINKASLPDSLFAPPADYQKLDMGGMMRGMGIPGMPGGSRPDKQQEN